VPAPLLLNEMDVNPPGSPDGPWEYVEIRGTPGAALTDIYVVYFGGDLGTSADPGDAEHSWSLSGFNLGSNGLLVIKSTIGGFAIPPETTVFSDIALDPPESNLGNGSCTFMIISSPTPIIKGLDYDGDNDGNLELPAGAVILDSVGWSDGDVGDIVYGGVILTQSSGTPDAASRFNNDDSPFNKLAWYNGDLLPTSQSETVYDPTKASSNLPNGAAITPGSENSHSHRVLVPASVDSDDKRPLPIPPPPVRSPELSRQDSASDIESVAPTSTNSVPRTAAQSALGMDLFTFAFTAVEEVR
jgi:hypothetical protein